MFPVLLFLMLVMWTLCPCGAPRPNKQIVEGVTFRTPGPNIPAILFQTNSKGPNGTIIYDGIIMDLIRWLSAHANIKFEFVELDESIRSKEGIILIEIYRMLANKEIDVGMVPLPMKWDQLETVDYSYPARFEEYRLMQKYPKEESRFTAILKPFSTSVWICSIAMVVVFIIILTIFTIFNPEWIENGRKLSVWEHLSRHFEYVICIIAYQGYYVPVTAGRAFFILCGFWGAMMLILTYAYSGNLTSGLVTPTYQPIANTLEDLINLNMKITTLSNTPLLQSFLTAVSGTNKMLGDYLRNHPDMIASGMDSATTSVLREDKCVFIGQADVINIIIAKNYQLQHQCSLTISKSLAYTEPYTFPMTKGNPFREILYDSLLTMWESGLVLHWVDKFIEKVDPCSVSKQRQQSNSNVAALSMTDLSSAFLLLAFGIGLATGILIMENLSSFILK